MRHRRIIDQLTARLGAAGILIGSTSRAPWIELFESDLGRRLPAPFADFVRRYSFQPFEWGPVMVFGNSGSDDPFNLHVAAKSDPAIWQAMRQAGLIQIGRPSTGGYDPICLDTRASGRELAVVQLDHETILIKNQIKVAKQIAPSFVALIESLIVSGSEPEPIEA
ncbi:MAG TPA: SMI1/KNR4 family protein [Dongiaceae bacterium]|jgi:hypothetical protein